MPNQPVPATFLGRSLGIVMVGLVCGLVGLVGVASAHGDDATFTPIAQEPVAGKLEARLRLTLIYNNDDDPVDEATVQVVPVGPDGAEGAAATLPRAIEPGTYDGTVPVGGPGAWTFRVESADPEASTEVSLTIPEPSAPRPAASSAAPATSAPAAPAVATSLPEGEAGPATDAEARAQETTTPSSIVQPPTDQNGDPAAPDGFPWGIAALVGVVVAVVVGVMVAAMRPGDSTADGADDGAGEGAGQATGPAPDAGGSDAGAPPPPSGD
ncbi:MAG: hypothetical protein R2754_10530 [Microthrixaceae bacterium]